MSIKSTCAIYLAFHPSDEDLAYVRNLARHLSVVVVSNSGAHDFGTDVAAACYFAENVGVGAGYNRGLELARSIGSTHVVFHDQDSRLDISQVEGALERLASLDPEGESLVMSLTPVDLTTGQVRQPRVTKPTPVGDLLQFREVQFSGLVAPVEVFSADPFSTYLFVDFVDFEWCWKVSPKVRFLRDPNLSIGHRIGSGIRTLLGFEYSVPSSQRFFFQWRNLVVLSRVPYAPRQWKVRTAAKFFIRSFALVAIERTRSIGCIGESIRGIRVGILVKPELLADFRPQRALG